MATTLGNIARDWPELDDQKDNKRYKHTHNNEGEDVEYHGYLLRHCRNVNNKEKRNIKMVSSLVCLLI
jgi:hypothetical protein